MNFPTPWLIIVAVIIGHFGLNVAIYNRINGTAIPRSTLKRITKVLLLWTIAGPFLISFLYSGFIVDFFLEPASFASPAASRLLLPLSCCLDRIWYSLADLASRVQVGMDIHQATCGSHQGSGDHCQCITAEQEVQGCKPTTLESDFGVVS